MLKKAHNFFKSLQRKLYNEFRKLQKVITFAMAKRDKRFLSMSHGNRKLHDTMTTAFLIWNLPSKTTCPYATEECKKHCYACKAEAVYPQVLPSRYNNLEISKSDAFVERMIFTIQAEYNSFRRWNMNKKLVVRIHESGDFYDKVYALKWLEIAKHFNNENVVFMAYTKSLPFFRGESVPENFVVRASVWCDTDTALEMESYENYPIYTAYTAEEIDAMKESGVAFQEIETAKNGAEWLICRCSDCGNCNACWDKRYKNVVCAIH